MDPSNYSSNRLFRLASHQGTGASWTGAWTNANFQVSLQNDLQRNGPVWAVSVESVGFPNLFPNVTPGHNTFLARIPTQQTAFWLWPGGLLTVTLASTGITRGVVVPAATGISNFITSFNVAWAASFGVVSPLLLTASFADAFTLTTTNLYEGEAISLGDEWFVPLLGFVRDVPSTTWYGWPRGAGQWQEISVPVGFYSNNQLGDIVTARLTATFGGLFEINPVDTQDQRFRLSVVPTPPNTAAVAVASPYNQTSFRHFDYQDLLYVMGFMFEDQGFPSTVILASQNPSLAGEQVVYVASQALCNQVKGFAGEGPPDFTFTSVPVTVGYGDLQTASSSYYNAPLIVYQSPWTPVVVDISLRNLYDDQLVLPDNQQFWVTLRLWYR